MEGKEGTEIEGVGLSPREAIERGKEIGGGAPGWLVREEDSEISNPELAKLVEKMDRKPVTIVRPEWLDRQFDRINEDEEISDRDKAPYLARIAEFHQRLVLQEQEVSTELIGELQESINAIVGEQRRTLQPLFRAYEGQRLALNQFLEQYIDAQKGLTENLWRLPPDLERARWIDVEYDQEFYTRFTPTMEPKFYAQMESEERKIWDARWQLARAAFFKKVNAAFPEKLFENQELQLLTNEQMERLYNIPGVRRGLEWYADEIVNCRTRIMVERERGRQEQVTILECKDESELETFRSKMREELVRGGIVQDEQQAKEADAVAWNWIWCSNLIESIDSRYSKGGERHGDLPGKMISDDLRSVIHPQEKFESKCKSGLRWGAFGEWGVTQVERIKARLREGDDIVFVRAPSLKKSWRAEYIKREEKVVRVYTPECYPTTSLKSFWEETTLGKDEKGRDKSLLDYLLDENPDRREIPWKQLNADPWVPYLPIRMRKAVQLFQYFKPGVPMETQKFGYAKAWVEPLIDCLNRLPALGTNRARGGKLDERGLHNLKVWAAFAAYGGVGHPKKRKATMNLGTIDRGTLERAFRDRNVRYLRRRESLEII